MPTCGYERRNMSEKPFGFCQCGCGQKTKIVKEKPRKYLANHSCRMSGENSLNWKNGTIITWHGYKKVYYPNHPRAHNNYVLEHVLSAEKALGKPLPSKAEIHHANGSRNSGTIIICQDRAYHMLLHQRERAYKTCGRAEWLKCQYCKQYDSPKNMYNYPSKNRGFHRKCHALYEDNRRKRP